MTAIMRLCSKTIWAFRDDGSCFDMSAPDQAEICFGVIAGRLSRINRSNGVPTAGGYSVAQHSVMGAEALLNEGEDEFVAGIFLLHDGREAVIGDVIRPTQKLIEATMTEASAKMAGEFTDIFEGIGERWDDAIYAAAGLPVPSAWTPKIRKLVKSMDDRMCGAEARTLLGKKAEREFPLSRFPTPKTKGAIRPWGAMKAEEAFVATFKRLIGEDRFFHAAALHAAKRELEK